jgi:hypothetical protein
MEKGEVGRVKLKAFITHLIAGFTYRAAVGLRLKLFNRGSQFVEGFNLFSYDVIDHRFDASGIGSSTIWLRDLSTREQI